MTELELAPDGGQTPNATQKPRGITRQDVVNRAQLVEKPVEPRPAPKRSRGSKR